MLAAATVSNIKIRYDAKTPQFAIFGTRVICVFYSIYLYTVKLANKDRPWEEDKQSLFTGGLSTDVIFTRVHILIQFFSLSWVFKNKAHIEGKAPFCAFPMTKGLSSSPIILAVSATCRLDCFPPAQSSPLVWKLLLVVSRKNNHVSSILKMSSGLYPSHSAERFFFQSSTVIVSTSPLSTVSVLNTMLFLLSNESSHPLDLLKVSLFRSLANFKACCWINGPVVW